MGEIRSKKQLAIVLSYLRDFEKPSWKLEQFSTDSENAAGLLWKINLDYSLEEKIVLDLACGAGSLGIAALLLGAKKVFFVDIDPTALEILKENLNHLDIDSEKYAIIESDIMDDSFLQKLDYIDIVLCNPPFGSKTKHLDRPFIDLIVKHFDLAFTFHSKPSIDYICEYVRKRGFSAGVYQSIELLLKQTQAYHRRKTHRIDVVILKLERK